MPRWLPLVLLLPGIACVPPSRPEEPPLDGGISAGGQLTGHDDSARASQGALLAAWQRTSAPEGTDGGAASVQDLSAGARTGPAVASPPEAEDSHAHVPALANDPALSAMPRPEPRGDRKEDAEPPLVEQLVVIPDRKDPSAELVLGPDGEPLEDTSLVLDDIDPTLDPEEFEPGLEPEGGADAGTYAIPYAPDAGSLRVKRSIAVRQEPRRDAPPLGTVAQDMRVRWKGETAMRGPDCDAWVEIEPRGWVCERYLEPNFREPRVRDLPKLREGELTPGTYARVVGKRVRAYPSLALARKRKKGVLLKGSVTVQLRGQVRVGRRTFWRTTDGQYLEARVLREYRPSPFEGVGAEMLAELPAPFAWAQSRTRPDALVEVRGAPDAEAARETVLPPRTLVAVRELSVDGRWVLIAENHWVARDDLHVAWFRPAPPEVGPGERWLDVDLEAQVLVAYEGERPVYATLISSGKPGTDTPEGLFRIWVKFAEADMTGNGTVRGDTYRVATVPWTMFFQDDYALHTAYWHDRFGEPMSHGCINLAPRDARALYSWAEPEVPTGWSMVHATPDAPGSWVRIRGKARVRGPERKVTVAATARRGR
ncbi:L,D-transpeptidase family protein [Myxococcus sp. RHSTA-1-4]|uniref:L,D-transpeptidase family protein n=1 Tax=Myxococcus sp. RHSTA-1-4 TaxID=2874601 RepID=UPI001CBF7837|nr:L,D-transpeptidase family protein [Myxococcus sp. RHSTA-1-4]MBZ4415099.1 L,D-transpeptidase family protein [Myxococcus sp. RHSTA-1-4]